MNRRRILELTDKTIKTLKDEGMKSVIDKSKNFISYRVAAKKKNGVSEFKDVLFINGCYLPHPQRYRVDHQMEQLESCGVSCAKVGYDRIGFELVKYFRTFVFYRCPITPDIEKFIKMAKENNKIIFYDIDDLVFDVEHAKHINYVDTMKNDEKKIYLDGLNRMGKTLKMCDYGIASTKRLKIEMEKTLKEVYVNRNVASELMVSFSQEANKKNKRDDKKIIMGYLSGSITHNDDFKLIMNDIVELLKKHDNLYLKIVGLLDLPDEMKCVKNKIIVSPFIDWKKLPELISSIDINLAPLEDTIFNEAKSENKWTEAALVKIPTIASDVGAFHDAITNNKNGLLCRDSKDWIKNIEKLVLDSEYRKKLGETAYNDVMKNNITVETGRGLTEFIKSKLNKNVCFVLPSTNISGGIMVAIKHAQTLKNNGYDVTLINAEENNKNIENKEGTLNVIPATKTIFHAQINTLVATMWLTLEFVRKYDNCINKKYLVQGKENGLYKYGDVGRILSTATYNKVYGIDYLTISKWCQKWLTEEFGNNVKYAPNGIDLSIFKYKNRTFKGKIKILIEGNSKDHYKNVDESFKIVEKLDKNKFEINYLSYEKEPKDWYYVDNFYQKIAHDDVGKIYQKCDILIKTSLLESFSYPPLEMMATGGICVAISNDGNKEFLVDEENCLLYEQGNINDAIQKINRICEDKELRKKLILNGLETADKRNWAKIEKELLKLYE